MLGENVTIESTSLEGQERCERSGRRDMARTAKVKKDKRTYTCS